VAIVWLDLRVSDLPRAQEFYHRLLGWTYESFEDIAVTVHDGGETLGMMSEVRAGGPASGTGAVVYLEVKDLRAALQVATSMGAHVEYGPEEDGTGAVFADLLDPYGLRIGLLQDAPSPEADPTGADL
jgi:predicted enzyme related to lactoylglutathione lyase